MRKFKGIRKTVSEINEIDDNGRGLYYEVFYNTKIDEVFTDIHCDLGQNWQTLYDAPEVYRIGNFSHHHDEGLERTYCASPGQ